MRRVCFSKQQLPGPSLDLHCSPWQIQDMVAIRHTACNEQQRTTMILLCEDGSLRIYMANVENTSYWLQPSLQPSSVISIMKPVRKRKAAAISKGLLIHVLCKAAVANVDRKTDQHRIDTSGVHFWQLPVALRAKYWLSLGKMFP